MIRRLDITLRRRVRSVFYAWASVNARAAMAVTTLAHAMPRLNDGAMCAVALLILALTVGLL